MAMGLSLGNLWVHLGMNASQYMAQLKTVETQMRATGRRMESMGRSLSMKLTLPILAVSGAMLKMGTSMESAFVGVRKTVDATEKEFGILQKGLEDMTLQIPLAFEELAKIGESAGQLGIAKANILDFVDTIAKLGATTNLASEQGATALARFANITQMSQDNFDRLGSTIVGLGNNFATTEAEIVNMAMRLAGAGSLVKASEAQILSFATAVSSLGIRAEAGGTAVSRILLEMNSAVISGTKELEVFAQTAGLSGKEFAKAFSQDAFGALTQFVDGLGRVRDTGGDVKQVFARLGLDNVRILDSFNRLSGASKLLNDAMKQGNVFWKENTALTREANLRFETSASRLRKVWNNVRLTARAFKDILMPPILNFLEKYINPLVAAFRGLNEETQKQIVMWSLLAAAVGPVLLIFGKLLSTVGFMVFGINALTSALKPMLLLLSTVTAALGPIVIAALALGAAAFVVRAAWNNSTGQIKKNLEFLANTFKQVFDFIANSVIGRFFKWFLGNWSKVWTKVKEDAIGFAKDFAGTMGALKAIVKGEDPWAAFIDGWESAERKLGKIKEVAIQTFETASIQIKAFGEASAENFSDLMNAVKVQFGKDADAIIAMLKAKMAATQAIAANITPTEALERINAQIEKLNEGLKNLPEAGKFAWTSFLEQMEGATNLMKRLEEVGMRTFDSIADTITEAAIRGKANWSEMIESILTDLLRMMVRMQMAKILMASFGPGTAGGSFLSGLFPAANGRVFSSGNIVPMAQGALINGPSLIPMANGNVALAGESGPEAIMPLNRDESGRLGVKSDQSQQKTKVVILFSEELLGEAMKTEPGEKAILHVMQRSGIS